MDKPILVTGATGTIGREVIRHLSKKNAAVRAGVRNETKARTQFGGTVELTTFNFEDNASYPAALKDVEKLFILPPLIPDQVEVTIALVDAAEAAGVRHIVKLSAIGAAPGATFTLGKWHGEADEYIRQSGLGFTVLRPNSFMQNFINYFPPRDGVIYLPWGEGKASFVDARDVGAVAAEALTGEGHGGTTYDLTGPEALGIADVARVLSTVAGREIRYIDVPEAAARDAMLQAHIPSWQVDALLELHAINKQGLWAGVTPDVEAITRHPATTFAQFALHHTETFRPSQVL
jgi:uncharacterized protein YbjT (DUF2867 family)